MRHGAEQNAALAKIRALCSQEDFESYRQAIGKTMAALLLELINPIVAKYPDLKRWKWNEEWWRAVLSHSVNCEQAVVRMAMSNGSQNQTSLGAPGANGTRRTSAPSDDFQESVRANQANVAQNSSMIQVS